jgi:hypothetical protein
MTREQREQAADEIGVMLRAEDLRPWSQRRFFTPSEKDALDTAIAALRGPVPDPETGLVRCGCKTVAFLGHGVDGEMDEYFVSCGKCGMSTDNYNDKNKAIQEWNLAMSGQTSEQKPVKTRNETPPKPGLTVQVSDNPGCKL